MTRVMTPTDGIKTACVRLAEALDYTIVREGRNLCMSPPEYAMEDYERAGLVHDPHLVRPPIEVLGHLIVGLHGEPNCLSYKEIWEMCRLDWVLLPKGGWWVQEVRMMVTAGRGY